MKPPLSTSLEHGTWARIEAEAKVTRLLDIVHSITRGTRVPLGQFRLRAAGLQVLVPANRADAKGAVGFGGRQALSQEPGLEGERREARSANACDGGGS